MISGYEYLQTFHKTSATTYESFDIGCSSKNRAKIHVKNCNNASIDAFLYHATSSPGGVVRDQQAEVQVVAKDGFARPLAEDQAAIRFRTGRR